MPTGVILRCAAALVGCSVLFGAPALAQLQPQDHSIGFSKKPDEEGRTFCRNRYTGRFQHWGACTAPEPPAAPSAKPARQVGPRAPARSSPPQKKPPASIDPRRRGRAPR